MSREVLAANVVGVIGVVIVHCSRMSTIAFGVGVTLCAVSLASLSYSLYKSSISSPPERVQTDLMSYFGSKGTDEIKALIVTAIDAAAKSNDIRNVAKNW